MNIIISENSKEINSKPSREFDKIYGTNLSQTYNFPKDLSSDEIWDIWVNCRDNSNCGGIVDLIKQLPKLFPYYDIKKLTPRQKVEVIMGMASEYNPSDIVYFAVHKVEYGQNTEQKRLEKMLPPEVVKNINWVLSPDSMEQIRNKFGINEI